MTVSDQILIAVRGWLLAATGLVETPEDRRIIPADDRGTRPNLPYITVRVMAQDTRTMHDERVQKTNAAGVLDENIIGHRRATVQLDAYGTTSDDLLVLSTLALKETRTQRYLFDKKIAITPASGITDLSELVDDVIEKRFTKDFYVDYAITFDDGSYTNEVEPMEDFEGGFTFNDTNFQVRG